ncbi:metal ABC transporter solute-binding protein, Zn/Mn family [Thermodesulfobacteriota bacterium]
MKRYQKIFSMALSILFILGPICLPKAYANGPIKVFVSIAPQKYFVKQIAEDLVDAQVMVEPGASPATYEPKPQQMKDISKTSLYFAIGVPFEKRWLPKIMSTNPEMKIIPTDQGTQKIPMSVHHHGKDEGSEKEVQHEHENLDPHIWLSPPYVILQARQILVALQETDPGHRLEYENNYKRFIQEIIGLDKELRDLFQDKQGLQFMVFHPSWGYFAQAYGLKQLPIEIEGKEPKPARLREIIKHARENNIKIILVQPQFSAKSARQLAKEINGIVVFADPLAENWTANLRKQSEVIREALR